MQQIGAVPLLSLFLKEFFCLATFIYIPCFALFAIAEYLIYKILCWSEFAANGCAG